MDWLTGNGPEIKAEMEAQMKRKRTGNEGGNEPEVKTEMEAEMSRNRPEMSRK